MLIDIIIPTYKPNNYLYDCLLSIQNQNICFDSFKVTVILNGEKEPYYSKIKNFLMQFNFDNALIFTDEKGVSNARNLGLENTQNPYVLFLDDDDLLSNNYLEKLFLNIEPDSIIVSNVRTFIDDKDNTDLDYLSFSKSFQSKNLVEYRRYLSNSCCKLIPRNIIGDNRFDASLFRGEDALFMFTISPKIIKIISTEPDVIYFRRIRGFSASRVKYSLFKELKIGIKQQISYSKVFFTNFPSYNFLLYITRLLAVVKVILYKIKG